MPHSTKSLTPDSTLPEEPTFQNRAEPPWNPIKTHKTGCFSAANLLQICEFPLFFEVSKTGNVEIITKLNLKPGCKFEFFEPQWPACSALPLPPRQSVAGSWKIQFDGHAPR